MTSDAGILDAVRRASRERLIRFVSFVDPGHVHWHDGRRVGPEALSDMALRNCAFCLASRFWTVRKTNRFWRNYGRVPARIPPDHTAFPSYAGPALDAWLRGKTPIVGVIEDRSPLLVAAE